MTVERSDHVRAGELAITMLAGLGIVAVFWLSLLAYSLTLATG